MGDFLINSRACQRIHANWGESVGFATFPGLKSIICPVNIVWIWQLEASWMAHVLGKLCILYYFAHQTPVQPSSHSIGKPFRLFCWTKVPDVSRRNAKRTQGHHQICFCLSPNILQGAYPTEREVGKIIDLKIPLEGGYVRFEEGISLSES